MSTPLSEQKSACSLPRVSEKGCITFIGMAGAGKTTVGRLVARALGWAFVDSDHIIEAAFAAPLQRVADAMSKEAFIDRNTKRPVQMPQRLRAALLEEEG